MKVLLINPPDNLEVFLGKGRNFVPILEPLGLLYIAAVCRRYDYNISVIDAFAEKISTEQLKGVIAKEQPDVVGFTCFVSNGDVIYKLGRWIKSEFPKITVVFGNVQASVYAEPYLRNNCCDIVVHGEGEFVFLNLLNILREKQNDFSSVPSISYLKDGKFITTSKPSIVENLSELPFPDRDAVNQELYNITSISNMLYRGKKNSVGKHMFTSRGCPFACTFCVVQNKKAQRFNSTGNVVNEIEILIKKYSTDYIFIMDPIFISDKKRTIDICREIKRRKLNFQWGCEGHIAFIDQELVEEMESAGCYDISFGIESGVQRLLDIVKKGNRLDRIEEAIKTVKNKTKIKVSGLFILGLPGEAYQDTLQTINFAKRLPLDMAQFSILVPYPGSQIFCELHEKGEIDTGLREDGTLDTSVWLRYSPYVFDSVNEPIWVTPDLTSALLKRLQKKALREFYFRPKQFCSQLDRLHLSNLQMAVQTFVKTFF